MKNIRDFRKFNESMSSSFFDYVKIVFTEFSDNDKEWEVEYEDDDYDEIDIGINMFTQPPRFDQDKTITEVLNIVDSMKNYFLEIESCLNKIKEEYPKVEHSIELILPDDSSEYDSERKGYIWIHLKGNL